MPSAQSSWGNASATWGSYGFTWGDVGLISALQFGRLGAYRGFGEEEQQRVIELICIVKGIKFKQRKIITQNIKVSVKDIDMLVTEMNKIFVNIGIKK